CGSRVAMVSTQLAVLFSRCRLLQP
ncbi:hypothetical protein NPIL_533321, partial [Nephila pilipes]